MRAGTGTRRRHYYQNTQGLIFVVDSNDRDRIDAARDEMHRMLNEDELRESILLVFANKQDLPNAMSAAEMTDKLGLNGLRHRQWCVSALLGPMDCFPLTFCSRVRFLPWAQVHPSLLRHHRRRPLRGP